MSSVPAILQSVFPSCGLVRGLPMDAYQNAGGLSYSGLKLMARSPSHFFAWKRDERRPVPVDKAGQLEGSLAHCMTLEPEEYPFRYVIGPDVSRATKEWKEFVARNPNRIVIKPGQAQAAACQAASIRSHPDVSKLLATGEAEVSAFWTDAATGVFCQCRPDFVHPVGTDDAPRVILVDVKTYADASPQEFARQVARKRYHWQAAFYSDGYAKAAGVSVVGFVFVAVESDWPYASCAVMLDEDSLDMARREMRPLIESYARCERENAWPGYPVGIEQIELPRWYAERFADSLS
jgi:hypothetical protein